ncbi:MAG: leucine-rich repeat domain-containing protein [Lachnospiraceae bacterium]|nr:leucine-rich repeat domain-containing protein [Lachnospiraceae bacterium]
MNITTERYNLICVEQGEGFLITGYEGEGAILDLSSDDRIIGIEKKAFLCCRSIKKVFLPKSLKYIGEWAFSKCDNLQVVRICGITRGQIFDRGVFDGCGALREISFEDSDSDLSVLLAASISGINKEHLLRADDIGQRFWYDKWDISLLSLLHSDEVMGGNGAPMGGEEDISYDGVSSVDGEMPGPQKNHMKGIGKNKCSLCYLRLLHNSHLTEDKEEKIEEYIRDRAYSKHDDMSWVTLKEEYSRSPEWLDIYLSVVKPDKETILKMIDDIGSDNIQLKAGLIDASGATDTVSSPLDELML